MIKFFTYVIVTDFYKNVIFFIVVKNLFMISKAHLLWRPDRALVTASGSAEHKSELEARRNDVKRHGTSFFYLRATFCSDEWLFWVLMSG